MREQHYFSFFLVSAYSAINVILSLLAFPFAKFPHEWLRYVQWWCRMISEDGYQLWHIVYHLLLRSDALYTCWHKMPSKVKAAFRVMTTCPESVALNQSKLSLFSFCRLMSGLLYSKPKWSRVGNVKRLAAGISAGFGAFDALEAASGIADVHFFNLSMHWHLPRN